MKISQSKEQQRRDLFNLFKGNMEKDSVLLIQDLLQYIMSSSINHFGQNYTF